jgi:hypothetical protein
MTGLLPAEQWQAMGDAVGLYSSVARQASDKPTAFLLSTMAEEVGIQDLSDAIMNVALASDRVSIRAVRDELARDLLAPAFGHALPAATDWAHEWHDYFEAVPPRFESPSYAPLPIRLLAWRVGHSRLVKTAQDTTLYAQIRGEYHDIERDHNQTVLRMGGIRSARQQAAWEKAHYAARREEERAVRAVVGALKAEMVDAGRYLPDTDRGHLHDVRRDLEDFAQTHNIGLQLPDRVEEWWGEPNFGHPTPDPGEPTVSLNLSPLERTSAWLDLMSCQDAERRRDSVEANGQWIVRSEEVEF